MKARDKFAYTSLTISVMVAIGAALFAAFSSEPAVGQNLCGNSCLSSADCMEGCVCMDDEGDGFGVCVSFN